MSDSLLDTEAAGRLDRGDGTELAWARLEGDGPTVVFLAGFRSDMQGSKAIALRDWCAAQGQAFLRFDYAGHGTSDDVFENGCIGRWAEDAAIALDKLTTGPLVLVGSSMGGWISLLLSRRMPDRIQAILGIAAAPDFTEDLMWPHFSAAQQEALLRDGIIHLDSPYGPPVPITRRLIEDGKAQRVLNAPLPFAGPVRLLQGMRDAEVPWQTAIRIADHIASNDTKVVLIKDGDHRLSRDEDIATLTNTLEELL
ncbi:alpha/beta hydrolase [Pseudoroseomonas deserti]|uniref:Alpha/beta hydrolase n=1 Tax=Teichococcus deserti TaxID=1817963 RepID=A0A1V2GTZ1_9PROT|nr:alpha/beta hydrolase [Pseudoroseomonas deserti]ONG44580.1 alpha/beta hydrolase [Pseudoroseomonas deserti]